MSNIKSVDLAFTQAGGVQSGTAQLIAPPTRGAGGDPIGGVLVVGLILRNNFTAAVTVILHNGTSAAGPIVSAMSLPAGSAAAPTVQDQDYADPRWCDNGLFMEVLGTTPSFAGTVWIQ